MSLPARSGGDPSPPAQGEVPAAEESQHITYFRINRDSVAVPGFLATPDSRRKLSPCRSDLWASAQ